MRPVRRDLEHVAGCLAGGFGGVDLSRAAVRIPTTQLGWNDPGGTAVMVSGRWRPFSSVFSFLVLTGCDLKPGGELFFCRLFFGSGPLAVNVGIVQALARCLRRHTFSVSAAVPVDIRTAPIVKGAVIMAVSTKASGWMPAMGVPRTRTTMTKIVSAAINAARGGDGDSDCPTVIFHDVGFLCTFGVGGTLRDCSGILETRSHGLFGPWTTQKSLKASYCRHSSYLYPLSRFLSTIG